MGFCTVQHFPDKFACVQPPGREALILGIKIQKETNDVPSMGKSTIDEADIFITNCSRQGFYKFLPLIILL